MKHIWLYINRSDLEVERQQLLDEGKDISALEPEFAALAALDLEDLSLQPRAQALLERAAELPQRPGYLYEEPSDLERIRRLRPAGQQQLGPALSDEALYDRVLGAWLGRCAGCLLGKPTEGWRSAQMWGLLKELGRYPLSDYFRSDMPAEALARYGLSPHSAWADLVDHMPEDDDTNYTATGLAIAARYGRDFTPADVADFWLGNIPILHVCTAERVAYRNLCLLIEPPRSAHYRNPYREWIGAQIRADFWGYVALGDPEWAAELAWRDASISHVKNGIYGEMWVAAMLAAAPYLGDARQVIEAGLAQIPARSRLAEDIHTVLAWQQEGIGYDEALARIHARWDETNPHHWCHTNANAQIVALGLLWGEGDYALSICRAVQACFDTDCNGATVGSILGMMLGARGLPEHWVGPLHDTLETGIAGYNRVRISELAREGLALFKAFRR